MNISRYHLLYQFFLSSYIFLRLTLKVRKTGGVKNVEDHSENNSFAENIEKGSQTWA